MEQIIDKIDLGSREQILIYLERTTKELIECLTAFSDKQINIVSSEGTWTAGQVAEHIIISESGLSKFLMGKSGPTKRRPDEQNDMIESMFLDFSIKMKSPDFVIPSPGPHNTEVLVEKIQANRKKLMKLARELDLSYACYEFILPGMGEFTRMEWFCFIICHSTRHIQQIRNIILGRIIANEVSE